MTVILMPEWSKIGVMAMNYHKLNEELDKILDELQSGELDIDEAVKKYERGQKIVSELETYLKTAKNKVTKVKVKLS